MSEYEGVTSESPTETIAPAPPADTSAGTINTGQLDQQAPPSRENWMPQARAEEMAQRRVERALEAQRQEFAQERQSMQEFFQRQSQQNQQTLLQGLQQRVNTPSRTPEEERQRQQAGEALNGLLADNPEWTKILQGTRAAPAMAQAIIDLQQRLSAADDRSMRSHLRSETQRLQSLATEAGIPAAQYPLLEKQVIGLIRATPDAHKALLQGDDSVVPWALEQAKQMFSATDRAARTALSNNKNAIRGLPPRIGGGQPGATPPPRFDPKDPRGSMQRLHDAADAAYRDRIAG